MEIFKKEKFEKNYHYNKVLLDGIPKEVIKEYFVDGAFELRSNALFCIKNFEIEITYKIIE